MPDGLLYSSNGSKPRQALVTGQPTRLTGHWWNCGMEAGHLEIGAFE